MKGVATSPAELGAEEVAAYLARHPDFLAARPELYRLLAPPRRVHGETLAPEPLYALQARASRERDVLEMCVASSRDAFVPRQAAQPSGVVKA